MRLLSEIFEQLKTQNAQRISQHEEEIRNQLESSLLEAKSSPMHFFGNFIGVAFKGFEGDTFVSELQSKPHIMNTYGVLQGGVTATVADVTMGFMLLELFGDVVTLEMKTNYMNPGKGTVFTSYARVIGRSGRHILCECKMVSDEGEVIAFTTGTFIQKKS